MSDDYGARTSWFDDASRNLIRVLEFGEPLKQCPFCTIYIRVLLKVNVDIVVT